MSIQVTSTSVSTEAAAQKAVEEKVEAVAEDTQSVSSDEQDETTEESETSKDDQNESEESESEDQDEESKEAAELKAKPKNGYKKKISKLTRINSEKDKEIEYLKGLVAKVNSQETKEVEAKKTETEQSDEPLAENFETHAEYVKAITKWTYSQAEKETQAKQKEEQTKSEYQKLIDSHQERVNKFRESTKDYNEVISNYIEEHGNIEFSTGVQEAIVTSDNGPALIYELAKTPDELRRINSLGPNAAAREIGKIEAKLSKESSSKEKTTEIKQSKAPAPINPVGAKGGSSVKKSIHDPSLTQAEYEQLRREQAAKTA